MKKAKGKALPLGVQFDGENLNVAVEVASGDYCVLKLYKKSEKEPSCIYELTEDKFIKEIRYISLEKMDLSITEYVIEVNGEERIDPYVLEVTGRKEWGNDKKNNVRGKIILTPENDSDDRLCIEPLQIPSDEVISYRLHVRGFTKHISSKVKYPGTFTGLTEKISYMKELGVNQIQLLPCFEFQEEGMKLNYWGYAVGYYMAPKSAYCATDNVINEFREMIYKFHLHGIEVILDMPFIDCPSIYYQIECMRYYVLFYQVDGFVLNPYHSDFEQLKKDPILNQVKLLNQCDDFQISMRKFLKGDEGMIKEVIWNLRKSPNTNKELTYNHLTNHNGFTMSDLVSYDSKHNELNGERNQDGAEYNYCWNCGAEGPSRKKYIVELRKKQMRNAWVLLMLAQGTPMILAGDEMANTQKGNNNAYCQDNEISWIDWRFSARNKELNQFVKRLIEFRKNHPVLHQNKTLLGMDSKACGIPDVSYHGSEAWIIPDEVASRKLGVLYSGEHVNDVDCYIAYNMHWVEHKFALPTLNKKKKWYHVLDTETGMIEEGILVENQRSVEVKERSISVFFSK